MLLPVLEHCLAAVFKPALQVPLIDWGLRDYGTPGQLGLEPTPEEYVANMVDVFREVWRVLRDDGTLWLNLGDSYASNPQKESEHIDPKNPHKGTLRARTTTCKPKDLVGIPWRVALALQADGWYLRSDIIWHKPNPMPESVTDRPTKAHEYIFLLSKSERYFYDAEAIKEPSKMNPESKKRAEYGGYDGGKAKHRGKRPGDGKADFIAGKESRYWPAARNRRTVWTVATKPYPGSHFATFPPDLIEPCILAGASPRACEVCGAPWERVVERKRLARNELDPRDARYRPNTYKGAYGDINGKGDAGYTETTTTGWQPTCTCMNEGKAACTVLDPFGGSGTTTMMCEQLGRDSVYIDLNPEYMELAKDRCGFGNKLIDTATFEVREVIA